MSYSIVWFKRDLRLHDNEAFFNACQKGPVLCLYVLEPSYWRGKDTSKRQIDFLKESLLDLARELKNKNLSLTLMTGEAIDVFERIFIQKPFYAVFSHQETGNLLTYQRDLLIKKWFNSKGVQWSEYRQHVVIRGLENRDQWKLRWEQLMAAPIIKKIETTAVDPEQPISQEKLHCIFPSQNWPNTPEWLQNQDPCHDRQKGGRALALKTLHSFLNDRSSIYVGGISSPLKASSACSRLSPYLSLGCLSLREVVQATRLKVQSEDVSSFQRRGLNNFLSRLYWHCHFIQKLESEPEIEWRNLNIGFDGLRETDWSEERFARLVNARTGWPLVDACVTMLKETGWLNFRMRAMLISVATYPLWLHWKPVGDWLASQFVDYEPGIHWSQVQMQSGTTGINTTRVYNPIKQALDHDPKGEFVRRWLPVLRRVPDAWIFEPWKMTKEIQLACSVKVGVGEDWPEPIVDLSVATRQAKKRLHQLKSSTIVRGLNPSVLKRHTVQTGNSNASPKTRDVLKAANAGSTSTTKQLTFDF